MNQPITKESLDELIKQVGASTYEPFKLILNKRQMETYKKIIENAGARTKV